MLLAALLAMLALAAVPVIAQVTQEEEQEGESAELDQSFEVTGSGDNSSQCANIQGIGNTGNAQNITDIFQYGSNITVSGTNPVTCDQQVNQAASAAA